MPPITCGSLPLRRLVTAVIGGGSVYLDVLYLPPPLLPELPLVFCGKSAYLPAFHFPPSLSPKILCGVVHCVKMANSAAAVLGGKFNY